MLRPLDQTDMPRFLELAHEMHASSVYSDFPFREDQTAFILGRLIEDEQAFAACYDDDGVVTGFMLGEVLPDPWVDVRVASDHAFFVTEGARGTPAGGALIGAFEQWAISRGAEIIRLSVFAGVDNERASRALSKLSYAPAGLIYKKEVASCV